MNQESEYHRVLRNRLMALRAKIEKSPLAGEIQFQYGQDYYQEEIRSMGLHLIREGWSMQGETMILDFIEEHYPDYIEEETKWINKMMRYLRAITETLIDNLKAEGYTHLQSNTDLPHEHALFYPIRDLTDVSYLAIQLDLKLVINLDEVQTEHMDGWLYFN